MPHTHVSIQQLILTQENELDTLFLEVYSQQLASNPAYASYVKSLSLAEEPTTWQQIPALPTDAFKAKHNPTSLLPEQITRTFLTSGTTSDTRGSHHFQTTATYETAIIEGWKHCLLPEFNTTFILTPSSEEAPHSSLSHMMETLRQRLVPDAQFIFSTKGIDLEALQLAVEAGKPVTLLGTALAFLSLCESLDAPLPLPPGSWAMETGGYKGSSKSLTKEQLYHLFHEKLKLAEEDIWNEYSMTELSSQFYTRGIGKPHNAPPWTRILVIDPETNRPVQPGELGYLVIYDLANLDSCLAIRTQDLAICHDSQSFTLIGRDPSALPRGCSRSI